MRVLGCLQFLKKSAAARSAAYCSAFIKVVLHSVQVFMTDDRCLKFHLVHSAIIYYNRVLQTLQSHLISQTQRNLGILLPLKVEAIKHGED